MNRLHTKPLLLLLTLLLLAAGSLSAQRRERPYVIFKTPTGPKKVECKAIAAAPDGRITVLTDTARNVYGRANYIVAVIPRPDELDAFADLLDDEKFNEISRTAPALFDKYKFLGYADEIARIHCEALMELNRHDEARKVLEQAADCPRADEFNLASIRLMLMVHDKKTAEVETQLAKLIQREDDALTAFAYLMRGRICEATGKQKEAVLQYLKTFMSFEDKRKVRRFRKAAKASALKLMKELNDPLAASLEQMK